MTNTNQNPKGSYIYKTMNSVEYSTPPGVAPYQENSEL